MNGAHDAACAGSKTRTALHFVLYDFRHTFATEMAQAGGRPCHAGGDPGPQFDSSGGEIRTPNRRTQTAGDAEIRGQPICEGATSSSTGWKQSDLNAVRIPSDFEHESAPFSPIYHD